MISRAPSKARFQEWEKPANVRPRASYTHICVWSTLMQ